MSSNKVPQSSDVPTASTDVEGVSPLVPLLLSRQGNDDEAGCREVPVVPIGEVSVVAAEATTGVVPQQVVSLLLPSRQTTLPATPMLLCGRCWSAEAATGVGSVCLLSAAHCRNDVPTSSKHHRQQGNYLLLPSPRPHACVFFFCLWKDDDFFCEGTDITE